MNFCKLSEASKVLGMSHKTLWRKVVAGEIMGVKLGIWRVDLDSYQGEGKKYKRRK